MSDRKPRPEDSDAIEHLSRARDVLVREIHNVIIGQNEVIEQILIGTFCRGHCLLVAVPGLAKTLMISTVARVLQLEFRRVPVSDHVVDYAIRLARATRRNTEERSAVPRRVTFVVPRVAPSCAAAITFRATMSEPWPSTSCGTASSLASTPTPRASTPSASPSSSSRPFGSRRRGLSGVRGEG